MGVVNLLVKIEDSVLLPPMTSSDNSLLQSIKLVVTNVFIIILLIYKKNLK